MKVSRKGHGKQSLCPLTWLDVASCRHRLCEASAASNRAILSELAARPCAALPSRPVGVRPVVVPVGNRFERNLGTLHDVALQQTLEALVAVVRAV